MALGSMLLIFTGVNPETDISRVKMICEVKLQKYKIITVFCGIVFANTNNNTYNCFM
jgi:hypothetical protein